MATTQKKTVLITGCSTGSIGWALAKVFLEHNFHVFAAVRSASKSEDLAQLSNVCIVELDVTLQETILNTKEIVAKHSGGTLDVLVNCAGIEGVRPLLDVDIAESKKLFITNLWGPLAVTQAFAPLVIKAHGIIANISSIGSVLPMVWAASGVRVVTVMCGSANTPIFGKPNGEMKLPADSYYTGIEETANRQRADHQAACMSPEQLAAGLAKRILSGTKDLVWIGTYSQTVRWGHLLLTRSMIDKTSNEGRGLEKVARQL